MSEPNRSENLDGLPARVAEVLRRDVPVRADWRAELLARIAADGLPGRSRPWYLRPGVAVAAAIALFSFGATTGIVASRRFARKAGAVVASSSVIRFVFVAPEASKVSVVGDFDAWNPAAIPLHRVSDGTWIGDVPLKPGRYAYAFMVDGTLKADPSAPRAPDGDFGIANSIVLVRGL